MPRRTNLYLPLSTSEFLTTKQSLFILEYMRDLNGTQAAIRAGYSPKTARSIASELLKKPRVQSMISAYTDEQNKLLEISRDAIVSELKKIAFANIDALFDETGKMKPPQEWTKKMINLVESFKIVHHYSGHGESRKLVGTAVSVKMKDKLKALKLLAKHCGMVEK